MNGCIVTEAMNYLDDSLLNDAIEYKRSSTARVLMSWKTWGAAAVCLLILSFVVIALKTFPKEGGSETIQEGNAYQLVKYDVPETYEVTTLYVATVANDSSVDRMIAEAFTNADVSKAIRVFHFRDDVNDDRIFYYPVIENDKISRLCFGTKLTDGRIAIGYFGNHVEEQISKSEENILMSLSSLTSPEKPLFLATDGSTIFYIIGNNAYCIDSRPERDSNLPAISTDGLEIRTLTITLK